MFLAECAENLPRTCRGLAQLVDAYLRSLCFCGLAPLGRDLLRGGGAAVVPPRGFQSAAHRRCAGRARLKSHRPQPKLQTYHKVPSSRWQAQVLCQALGPLSFSLPRSLGTTADPAPRSGNLLLCGFFFRFFALPNGNPNFASKKH